MSLQIGVDNIGNQRNGQDVNGNGNNHNNGVDEISNENGDDNGHSNGHGNGDENGGNGNGNGREVVVASSSLQDKAEIEDKEVGESEIKEPESKINDQDAELRDDNNLNRVAINELRIELTTLYNRPTARREENFDETTKQLFDRYTQLTNRRTSDQQKKYFEGLTVRADNALVNEAKKQERIKQIERQLREEYEVAEINRQPTFDMFTENLWKNYGELVNEETVSNLRAECENLVLTVVSMTFCILFVDVSRVSFIS